MLYTLILQVYQWISSDLVPQTHFISTFSLTSRNIHGRRHFCLLSYQSIEMLALLAFATYLSFFRQLTLAKR